MNPRQHSILTHLQRLFSALLPGGTWQLSRLWAEPCPAERVINHVMQPQTKRARVDYRGYRKA